MRYISFFAVFALFISFMSCGPKGNADHIAQLDSLLVVVDSCQIRFERVQREVPIDSLFNQTQSQMDLVREVYTDSTDQQFWVVTMSDYYAAHKVFRKFRNQRDKLREEISLSRKQIEDLKHDERKGLVPEEKSLEFFEKELMAVQALYVNVDQLYSSAYSAQEMIDTLTPIIQGKLEQSILTEISQ